MSRKLTCLFVFFVALAFLALVRGADDEEADTILTCGSVIKLKHTATGVRLHSHGINYGSGSGQQSVTGFPGATDPNSLWVVKGAFGQSCPTGTPLKSGDIVRLFHASTSKYLHSHHQLSPLSKQQEVSAYVRENGEGDTGDNWRVEVVSTGFLGGTKKDAPWKRGESVRFWHMDTKRYLNSHKMIFGHPIPNQQEVTCSNTKNDNTIWETVEGIYFPASENKPTTPTAADS